MQQNVSGIVFAVVIGLWALAGCQRVWKEDPANALGKGELVEPVASPHDIVALFPLRADKGRFQIVEGDDDGYVFGWRLEPVGQGWVFTYEGYQQVWLRAEADGALRIVREDDLDEEVQVTYEPALLMLPTKLEIGEAISETVTMTVRSLDGSQLRSVGTCINTVTLLGVQTVSTPAGAFEAVIVETRRQVQLPIARVEVQIISAFVPGRGQVAERVVQKVRALGLFDTEEVREERLVE